MPPFVCACGQTRFIELAQWNATNCRLDTDPENSPVMILCWACRRIYRQASDWSWKLHSHVHGDMPHWK